MNKVNNIVQVIQDDRTIHKVDEAAESMEQDTVPDWNQLSLELGYYDQSHFIRDFKDLVGRSPEEYVRKRTRF